MKHSLKSVSNNQVSSATASENNRPSAQATAAASQAAQVKPLASNENTSENHQPIIIKYQTQLFDKTGNYQAKLDMLK